MDTLYTVYDKICNCIFLLLLLFISIPMGSIVSQPIEAEVLVVITKTIEYHQIC